MIRMGLAATFPANQEFSNDLASQVPDFNGSIVIGSGGSLVLAATIEIQGVAGSDSRSFVLYFDSGFSSRLVADRTYSRLVVLYQGVSFHADIFPRSLGHFHRDLCIVDLAILAEYPPVPGMARPIRLSVAA